MTGHRMTTTPTTIATSIFSYSRSVREVLSTRGYSWLYWHSLDLFKFNLWEDYQFTFPRGLSHVLYHDVNKRLVL